MLYIYTAKRGQDLIDYYSYLIYLQYNDKCIWMPEYCKSSSEVAQIAKLHQEVKYDLHVFTLSPIYLNWIEDEIAVKGLYWIDDRLEKHLFFTKNKLKLLKTLGPGEVLLDVPEENW